MWFVKLRRVIADRGSIEIRSLVVRNVDAET